MDAGTALCPSQSIASAIAAYLGTIRDSRSANTAKAYRQALQAFSQVLAEHDNGHF